MAILALVVVPSASALSCSSSNSATVVDAGSDVAVAADTGSAYSLSAGVDPASVVLVQGLTNDVSLTRGGSYGGRVNVTVSGLPPGVSAQVPTLDGLAATGKLVLRATASAPTGAVKATIRLADVVAGKIQASAELDVTVVPPGGAFDSAFSGGRLFATKIGAGTGADLAYAVAVQSDNKIVIAGSCDSPGDGGTNRDFALVRFQADGSLDTTFGNGGKVIFPAGPRDDEALAVAVQSDGKIVAAGYTTLVADGGAPVGAIAVARFTSTGSPDASFNADGVAVTPLGSASSRGNALAIQADGKIVVAGQSLQAVGNAQFVAVRYDGSGALDSGFDGDGVVERDLSSSDDIGQALALQPDGAIVVGGSTGVPGVLRFAATRLSTAGGVDGTYGGSGVATSSPTSGTSLTVGGAIVLPDGNLLLTGGSASLTWLARFGSSGSADTTFDSDGLMSLSVTGRSEEGRGLLLAADGKILIGARTLVSGYYGVARFLGTGLPDPTFGSAGKIVVAEPNVLFSGIALQNGKIIVAGYRSTTPHGFYVARLLP